MLMITNKINTENKFAADFNFGFAGSPNNIEEVKKLLGQRWQVTLQKIYFLIKAKKMTVDAVIELTQTDCRLEFIGSHQLISHLIKKCKLIKLLDPVKLYGKESYKAGRNGKSYHVNKALANIIAKFCKENDYKDPAPIAKINHADTLKNFEEVASNYDIENEIFKGVKIAEYKGEDFEVLKNYPDEVLLRQLYKNYPQIKLICDNNDKFNALCNVTELQRRSVIKVHRGEDYIKFSFRDYSEICSLIKSSDDGRDNREAFFKRYFNISKPAEYDLKSSIYKITHFINFGVWADNTRDFYADFAPEGIKREQRDLIKLLCMYVYFSDLTDKQIVAQAKIREYYKEIFQRYKEEENKKKSNQNNKFAEAELALTIRKTQLQNLVAEIRENMCKVIGKTLGAEVFVHESVLMSNLYRYLIKRYGKAVCVYDAVFVDCAQDELNQICNGFLTKFAKFYRENYIKS